MAVTRTIRVAGVRRESLSRRVKRERGAASSSGGQFRDCPRNGKPFEGRSFMPLPHVAAGRRAVRTASPETGLRPGGIAVCVAMPAETAARVALRTVC